MIQSLFYFVLVYFHKKSEEYFLDIVIQNIHSMMYIYCIVCLFLLYYNNQS